MRDYYLSGFTKDIDLENTKLMTRYIDPIFYSAYFSKLPYLIVCGTND